MSIVRELRKTTGFTQKDLSEKSGLSLRTIQRLESSNKKPEGYTLTKLSEVFQLTPANFLSKFDPIEDQSEEALGSLKLINLSILACLGIPFGNVLVPSILWYKWRDIQLVNEVGKRIINLQIILTALMCLSLSLSPFLDRFFYFPLPMSLILITLFTFLALYVIVAFTTAAFLHKKNTDILHLPIQLI